MKLIDEKYEMFKNTDDIYNKMFWLYCLDKRDFFLRRYDVWYNLNSETYVLQIGKHVIKVPANYYILIGDYDVGLDTITPHNIVGRDFDAYVFGSTLDPETWELEPIKVIGYEEENEFTLPFTKHPFPVLISENKAILISSVEIWNKIKHLSFQDIV